MNIVCISNRWYNEVSKKQQKSNYDPDETTDLHIRSAQEIAT